MPTTVQFRRGTEAQNNSFTGNAGEMSVDTTNKTIRVHDGSAAGGSRLATYAEVADRMQVANVQSLVTSSINNVLDSAPGTLDTLNELAAAIGDDADFLSKVQANIDQKLGATASVTLTGDVTGSGSFSSNAVSITLTDTNLGNTNSYIAATQSNLDTQTARVDLLNTNLTSTNTAIRSLISATNANVDQKLGATASVTLTGDVTGTASFSSNAVSITTTIADDSHNHVISNVDGLQNELDSKIEVANAIATFSTLAQLGNTNSYIAGVQSNLDATNANVDQKLGATASVALTGAVTGSGSFSGNSISITTTATADPTITLGGDLTGSVTLTNLGDGTLTATVVDDSHNHIISNVDGLQNELDSKIEVANAIATFSTLTQLGNTNSYIAGVQSNLDTTNANVDQKLGATASVTLTGAVTGTANFSANAVSITTTATSDPTITLGGDLTGSVTLTNLGDGTLTAAVVDDSHNHSSSSGAFTVGTDLTVSGGDIILSGTGRIQGIDTVSAGTDAANKTYVDTAVANIVDTAPEALNTLNELAAALGDDANFATTTATSLGTKAANTYVNSTFQTIAVERAALANTNAYIATKQATITGGATSITSSDLTASRALVSDGSGKVAVSAVTSTEVGYLDGVTSAIQTQLNAKQATITGAATTIDTENLTVSRALVSDGSGKVAVSAVTSTELGYLDGVTSAIQTQLNAKGVGSITGVTAGVGLSGGGASGTVTLTLDMSELTDMTAAMVGTDEFIVLDASADRRKAANEIGLSIFNNDAGFQTTSGTVTNTTNFNVEADNSTNATHYPIFTGGATGNQRPNSDTGLTYNPSTGILASVDFNSTSDETLKQNIETIENASDKILKLRGVNFNWKDNDRYAMGVVAQEVEKVVPEVVNETDGIKNVSYGALVGLLIEAVKDLKNEIEELKAHK